ncbi:MAG: LysM peptidoglycan-binding domain-containing protein [Bacteroidales bacterium]
MKCPVCNLADVPNDQLSCPECQSNLEAFHLANKIENTLKSRLRLGIVASVLFVVVLVGWSISTGFSYSSLSDQPDNEETKITNAELEKLQKANQFLKDENKHLKNQLVEAQTRPETRKEEYTVQEGESLFSIARKVYGNGYKYVDLAKDNNIVEPSNLLAGQKLIIYY